MKALKWALPLVLIAGSAAVGFALFAPMGTLSTRPAVEVTRLGGTLEPHSSLAQGSARFEKAIAGADQQIAWQIAAPRIAPPGIGYRMTLNGALSGAARVALIATHTSVRVQSGSFSSAAATLFGQSPQRVRGQISLVIERADISMRKRQLQALNGQIVWQDAMVMLDQAIDLGTVHGALSMSPDTRVQIDLRNTGGALSLSGTVLLDPATGSAALDLLARPGTDAGQTLIAILESWGTAQGDAFAIRQQISLR